MKHNKEKRNRNKGGMKETFLFSYIIWVVGLSLGNNPAMGQRAK